MQFGDKPSASEPTMVKKCDIIVSENNKVGKEILVKNVKSDKFEKRNTVHLRSATNHDRCNNSMIVKDNKHSKTDVLESSNLSKSSSSVSVQPSLPPAASPTKTSSRNMSPTSSSLSNSLLKQSSLLSNAPLIVRPNERNCNESLPEEKEEPWGFAAAAQKQTDIFGSDVIGSTITLKSFMKSSKVIPVLSSEGTTWKSSSSSSSTNSSQSRVSSLSSLLHTPLGSTLSAPLGSPMTKGFLQPGVGQLKGLYDGLSHLFATPAHSRFRSATNSPDYNPGRRKPRKQLPKRKRPIVVNENKIVKQVPKTTDVSHLEVNKFPSFPLKTTTSQSNSSFSYLSPSFLVKTAVNAKQQETERRRMFHEEGPCIISESLMRLKKKQALKRELIAEATEAHHHPNHHPVPPIPPQTVSPATRSGKKLPGLPRPSCLPCLILHPGCGGITLLTVFYLIY